MPHRQTRGSNGMPDLHYLLDTDWAINYLKGDVVMVERVDGLLPQGVGLSIISLAELYEGLQVDEGQRNVFDDLSAGLTVLPLTDPACRIFARERRRLRGAGNAIPDLDLLIGATAICNGLIPLTNNHRHFSRMEGINLISDA